jgi:two-component system cell cycle response regulator
MKILLADDEPIARTMLEHWLTGWGYQVTCARDGEAALNAFKADPELRLAIIDWVMPKMDGTDVCRALRSGPQEPYVYVVLLTARDRKDDIVRGLDAGADDYLVKPCNPLELEVRLRTGRRLIELQQQLVRAREALRFEAMHDALTGLLNRRALLSLLDNEMARADRTGSPISVIMGDLDRFKAINDCYGHAAGDAVLREAAQRMKTGVRAYDSVGRVGGEEFMLILPDCPSRIGMIIADRLRELVCAAPIKTHAGEVAVTTSLGVASSEQVGRPSAEELTRAADAALYRAKHAGRNRVMLASDDEWDRSRSSENGAVAATLHPVPDRTTPHGPIL